MPAASNLFSNSSSTPFPLSPAQQKAVDFVARPLLILAGPGTGKTRVLTSKILKLVEKGSSPDRILALTFSRRAVTEMEERVHLANPSLMERVSIRTFHAFCLDLVERHGFRLGLGRKPELYTEAQMKLFLRKISSELPLGPLVKSSVVEPLFDELLNFFQDAKDEGLWPEDVIRFAENLPTETEEEEKIRAEWLALGDVYNSFQSLSFDRGCIDFGDAVLLSIRLLQEFPQFREETQTTYDAILVDEFQDTNWSQIQLLKLVCGPKTHISVVGDDDQSIYRFRGASYSAFRFFEEAFGKPEIVELTETYRLSDEIATASSQLILANGSHRYQPNKRIQSKSGPKKKVRVFKCPSFEQEATQIALEIKSLLDEGVAPNSIAVLARAHAHAQLLMEKGRELNLPLSSPRMENLFRSEIIEDVLCLFRLIADPRDQISFLRLLDSPFLRLPQSEILKFCLEANISLRWTERNLLAWLDRLDAEKSNLQQETQVRLKELTSLLKNWISQQARIPASQILMEFLEWSKVVGVLLESDPRALKALARFHTQLFEWERAQGRSDFASLFLLLESIAQYGADLNSDDEISLDQESVNVLTIHASKGLEFEHVFILSLVGRRFPGMFRKQTWMVPNTLRREEAPTKETHLEEERRLLYVAMTRAKTGLTLSTIEKKGTKPSLFLVEDLLKPLGPSFFEMKECSSTAPEDQLNKPIREIFARASGETTKAVSSPNSRPLSLSFTQLDKFETCPLSYRFRYELGIPSPPSPTLSTGSAVHEALELFYRKIQKENTATKEDLVYFFEKAFERERQNAPELTDRDFNLARDRLQKFFEHQNGNFGKPHALEQAFSITCGPHSVRGKIDRIDRDGDGFIIIDYKTGRSRSSDSDSDRKFAEESLQLSIYALAAKESLGLKVKELMFYYVYDNTVLRTSRTESHLEETKERIVSIATRIQEKKFEATPGFACQWCEYRVLCPSAQNA